MLLSSVYFNSLDIILFKLLSNVHFCAFCSTHLNFCLNLLIVKYNLFVHIKNSKRERRGGGGGVVLEEEDGGRFREEYAVLLSQ